MARLKYIILLLFPQLLFGQQEQIPRNSDIHHFLERQNILRVTKLHNSLQYFNSKDSWEEIVLMADSLEHTNLWLAEKVFLKYPEYWELVTDETPKKEFLDSTRTFYVPASKTTKAELWMSEKSPVFKHFYRNPVYFFTVDEEALTLKVNPVIYFGLGRDLSGGSTLFQNTRGIEISGQIDGKVSFYSNILENQAAFPSYIEAYVSKFRAIPGQGLYKTYNSAVLGRNAGYDFLNAQAYIASKITKSIGFEFGHGRNFIGHGQRSLLLSDFSNNAFFLKFHTKVWKLHYQNLFTQLIPLALRDVPGDQVIPRKFAATHYLSFKHRQLEFGFFETAVYGREEGFEWQYFNPVILYRLVEHGIRSSDNIIIGLNASGVFFKSVRWYGQLVLDEFKFDELILRRNGPGWWANKYGIQAGLHYINAFGVENLDVNLEYNRVRPYTYGHWSAGNYAHYNMSLAHPLGANFEEGLGRISYYFNQRTRVIASQMVYRQGLDFEGRHYGSDITRPTTERIMNYGNQLLQGNKTIVGLTHIRGSYEFYPNYFIELNMLYRSQRFETGNPSQNLYFSGGLRINFWEPETLFL